MAKEITWQKSLIINLTDDGYTKDGAQEYVEFVENVLAEERNRLLDEVEKIQVNITEQIKSAGFTDTRTALEAQKAILEELKEKLKKE